MSEYEVKTFEENMGKDLELAKTSLRKLCAKEFDGEPDACSALRHGWKNTHGTGPTGLILPRYPEKREETGHTKVWETGPSII